MAKARIIEGDCREVLASLDAGSVQTCVTSPPYYDLRDYEHDDQIGQEGTPEEYVEHLVEAFAAVRRVLSDDGTLWVNLGDSYSAAGAGASGKELAYRDGAIERRARRVPGLAPKNLIGIPWRVAFALQADGWYLRQEVIWSKKNCMPENVKDRPTRSHEQVFLLSKSLRYFYDADAIAEEVAKSTPRRLATIRTDGPLVKVDASRNDAKPDMAVGNAKTRNKRSVWTIGGGGFSQAHFATFPPKLIEPCILAGSRPGDMVLDPFAGASTTGLVACHHDRDYVGVELNPGYAQMGRERIQDDAPLLNEVAA